MASLVVITLASLLVLATAQVATTYIDCVCSASPRGFRRAVQIELREDLRELVDLRNQLLIDQAQDPSITSTVIQQRLRRKAEENFEGCTNNYSAEECVNADASLRYRAGNYRTSLCKYSRTTWASGGKPSCDRTPGLRSDDPDINAGRPELPSAKPPVTTTPPPQAPKPKPTPPPKAAPTPPPKPVSTPAPKSPAPAPAPPSKPQTPGKPTSPSDDKPKTEPEKETPTPGKPPSSKPEETEDKEKALPIPERGTPTPKPTSGVEGLELAETPSPATPAPTPVCFPSSARVEIEDGSSKRMDELTVGDRVAVGGGMFAEVFMFTHKLANVEYEFVSLHTAAGPVLRLSHGHYLPLNSVYRPASEAKVGDLVVLGDGTSTTIAEVSSVVDVGLFNPQTQHGDIVVDGVLASTYTTAVEPSMAHALLAPLRLMSDWVRVHFTFLDSGADHVARFTSLFA